MCSDEQVPRGVYDAAITWAAKAERTTYWKPFKDQPNADVTASPLRGSRSNGPSASRVASSKIGVHDKSPRTEEYKSSNFNAEILGTINGLQDFVGLE